MMFEIVNTTCKQVISVPTDNVIGFDVELWHEHHYCNILNGYNFTCEL